MSEISNCSTQKQTFNSSFVEANYSDLFSLTKYLEFAFETIGKETLEEKVNKLLEAFLNSSPSKQSKFESLKWNTKDELIIGNEDEMKHWESLHNNDFEDFKQLNQQKINRYKDSIIHYVIPISIPVQKYRNGKNEKIKVKAYGLSLYASPFSITFKLPEKYISLSSVEVSKFSLFGKYLGLKNFNIEQYSMNFREDFKYFNAYCLEGPLIRIRSTLYDESGEKELNYYGDYTFNIHMKSLVEVKKYIPKTISNSQGKPILKEIETIEYHGRKEGTAPISKLKYSLLFKWMETIKDYSMAAFPVRFVKTSEDQTTETDYEEFEEAQELNI